MNPEGRKLERQNYLQYVKNAKLYSNLIQAQKDKTPESSGFSKDRSLISASTAPDHGHQKWNTEYFSLRSMGIFFRCRIHETVLQTRLANDVSLNSTVWKLKALDLKARFVVSRHFMFNSVGRN